MTADLIDKSAGYWIVFILSCPAQEEEEEEEEEEELLFITKNPEASSGRRFKLLRRCLERIRCRSSGSSIRQRILQTGTDAIRKSMASDSGYHPATSRPESISKSPPECQRIPRNTIHLFILATWIR